MSDECLDAGSSNWKHFVGLLRDNTLEFNHLESEGIYKVKVYIYCVYCNY